MDIILEIFGLTAADTLNAVQRAALTVAAAALLIALTNAVTRRLIRARTSQKLATNAYLVRYLLLGAIGITAVMSIISGSARAAVNNILASSGIIAVALSIACQEPIGNLCSGLIIMITQPFRIGELVCYLDKDIWGFVEEITLRHTVLLTFDNRRVVVPNSSINRSAIENSNYKETLVHQPVDFNITYDSDLEEAMRIITDIALAHPQFRDNRTEQQKSEGEPPVFVFVRDFTESGVSLRARVWAPTFGDAIMMKSDILLELRRRFKAAGIRFAHPRVQIMQR